MARPLWFVELLKKAFPRRFLIAKLTKAPIIGKFLVRLLDKLIFEGSDIIYLPIDQVITQSGEVVLPSQIVEHFIKSANYHWIMNFCLCRASAKCKEYPIELGCLFLGEAAMGINPQLGHRATKEEALEHVRRCREAGLVHLIGRDKLDTAWLNVGPNNKLLTICNCCNCCCLWRILPNLASKLGDLVKRIPSVKVRVTDRCVGCGTCTKDTCFVEAIQLVDKKAVIGDTCRGCGRCVNVCPQQAIELSIGDDQYVQKSIERISAQVDLS
ncbi:MAG: 4Fe-4S binding protein [Candidatus Helarchaeota archaeon]|nr:4Fe-4S binding protein [Candidatus Helarchaeota archaeon]